MTNLLEETIDDIKRSGHKIEDIIFIGSEKSGYSCTWDEFRELADEEYTEGFGAQKVATDLIIVFSDGAGMWRHEYDGSERWMYSVPFKMPTEAKPIKCLFAQSVGWDDLDAIHKDLEEGGK
ncbi:MAG: hypothetical protein RBR68_14285 [Tenuifilaceae bacterium]|nr:hypothetical protein [Tenuifilaceae bacterium]